MTRVKGGVQTRKNHKKVLQLAKGYRMTRRKQIKKATEAVLHAGQYAYAGRKLRKRDFRSLWITRLNAVLRDNGSKYSTFVSALKTQNVELDRKVLAQMAVEYPQAFVALIKSVTA
jgi:large subunit ribosomal protein L20